jgi:hypothetical protein
VCSVCGVAFMWTDGDGKRTVLLARLHVASARKA